MKRVETSRIGISRGKNISSLPKPSCFSFKSVSLKRLVARLISPGSLNSRDKSFALVPCLIHFLVFVRLRSTFYAVDKLIDDGRGWLAIAVTTIGGSRTWCACEWRVILQASRLQRSSERASERAFRDLFSPRRNTPCVRSGAKKRKKYICFDNGRATSNPTSVPSRIITRCYVIARSPSNSVFIFFSRARGKLGRGNPETVSFASGTSKKDPVARRDLILPDRVLVCDKIQRDL